MTVGGAGIRIEVAFAALALLAACSREPGPTVGAATSLRNVLPEILAGFEPRARVSYAASGVILAQLGAGAPFDLLVLAGAPPIDALIAEGGADPTTRTVLAENRLVLIVPAGSPPLAFRDLAELPPNARLAIGDPAFVPVGSYAKTLLEALDLWAELGSRLVLTQNVAAALAYARRGEVDAAIVYETDALGLDDVRIADRADPALVRPLVVAAVPRDARHGDAARTLLAHLGSPGARAAFARHGFALPEGP